jgi:hypothetical protein
VATAKEEEVSGAVTADTARAAMGMTREQADTARAAADTARATLRRKGGTKAGARVTGAGAKAAAATEAVGSSVGRKWATSSQAGATEVGCRRKCRRNLTVRTCVGNCA